jgi:two-component system response regulator NreC
MAAKYRAIIADDYEFFRKAVVSVLQKSGEFEVIGEAKNGSEVLDLLRKEAEPDVVILDIAMPLMSGIEVLRRTPQRGCKYKRLMLTMNKTAELLCEAFLCGADGYVLKEGVINELLPALHTVLDGRIYVSRHMAKDLPDTCQVKRAAAEGLLSFSLKHCNQDAAKSIPPVA